MALTGQFLSGGGGDGTGIKVTGTNTAGAITVHTADATAMDYITIKATNHHTAGVLLTLEWGGATDPDNLITYFLQPGGEEVLIVSKQPLSSSAVVEAFAGTANQVVLYGSVDRVT